MKYSDHIDFVCKKVKKRIGWFLRTFRRRDIEFMKFIWKVYMLPVIDYCSQLWAPHSGPQLLKLENLQRNFTARISGLKSLKYWERLDKLKIYSIIRRIERYKILYTRKIIKGETSNCGFSWQISETKGAMCIVPAAKKSVPEKLKTIRYNSFQIQGPVLFNTLSRELRDNMDISTSDWKYYLDTYLEGVPDQPVTPTIIPGTCNMYTAEPSNSLIDWTAVLGTDRR